MVAGDYGCGRVRVFQGMSIRLVGYVLVVDSSRVGHRRR